MNYKEMAVRVIALGLLVFLSLTAFADTLTGKVVKITDGDTLYVLDANYQQYKIPPWAVDPDGDAFSAWARVATLMAGPGRGTWFIPDVDDEVLLAFEAGNPRRAAIQLRSN